MSHIRDKTSQSMGRAMWALHEIIICRILLLWLIKNILEWKRDRHQHEAGTPCTEQCCRFSARNITRNTQMANTHSSSPLKHAPPEWINRFDGKFRIKITLADSVCVWLRHCIRFGCENTRTRTPVSGVNCIKAQMRQQRDIDMYAD